MLTFLTRRRRPAVRRPFARRLEVEALEGRDAPSSLDGTVPLAPGDTAPDSSDTPAGGALIGSAAGVLAVTGAPAPAAGPAGILTPIPPAPPVDDPTAPPPAPGPGAPATGMPVIIDAGYIEMPCWLYTIGGMVSDPNPASLTVQFSGGVLDQQTTPVQANGTFQITFELPPCTSQTTAYHTYGAIASDGHGRVSAQVFIEVIQTPLVRPKL